MIHWPLSKVRFNIFKLLFHKKHWAVWSQISYWGAMCDVGMKIYSNIPGHIIKMASMSIYGKNLQNLLLRNQEADDVETWYTASGTQVLPNLFNWWPWRPISGVRYNIRIFAVRRLYLILSNWSQKISSVSNVIKISYRRITNGTKWIMLKQLWNEMPSDILGL